MLSSTTNKIQYTLSGTFPTTYTIPFKYWAKDEIVVILTFNDGSADQILVETTDYTLTDPNDTGTLTKVSAWGAAAIRLTIYRWIDMDQQTDYRNGEAVDMELLEQDFDRQVARLQQLKEISDRQSTIPITDSGAAVVLPARTARALKVLGFDAAGDAIAADIVNTPVSNFMKTVLIGVTAGAALATMGIDSTGDEIDYVCDTSANVKALASADYTVLANDGYRYILVTTGSSQRTITLPAVASSNRRIITVVKVDPAAAGNILLDGNGSETIDGSTTLFVAYAKTIICDGTAWFSVERAVTTNTLGAHVARSSTTGGFAAGALTVTDTGIGINSPSPVSAFDLRDGNFTLTDSDVAHGMTTYGPTNAWFHVTPRHATLGGATITGLTGGDALPIELLGIFGTTDPTDTYPAVLITGMKKNGTGGQALGAAETVSQIRNYTTNLITVLGNGWTGFGVVPTAPVHVVGAIGGAWGEIAKFFDSSMATGNRVMIDLGQSGASGKAAWMAYYYDSVTAANTKLCWGHYGVSEQMTLTYGGTLIVPGIYSTTVGATYRSCYVDNTGLIGGLTSARKFKENIREYTIGLDFLKNTPVEFDYIDRTKGVNQIGLIADDVAEICPQIVNFDQHEDGSFEPITLDYGRVSIGLLSAARAQQKQIAAVISRLEIIEGARA